MKKNSSNSFKEVFSISSIIDDLPSVFQYLVRLHDAAFQGHQGGLVGAFGISL